MVDLGLQNIVAAGSVVINPSGDYEVLAGNPARAINNFAHAHSRTR
jgi:acetyltransferase-like isoleucine patch superfamily enzyme